MTTSVGYMPAYSSNPQEYMDFLSSLHSEVLETEPKFLVNDTFISHAIKIAQKGSLANYPGARSRLLPKAEELLSQKEAFDTQVATGAFMHRTFQRFINAHTEFTLAFATEMKSILNDTPYMYKKERYPKTVAFMEGVYLNALTSLDPDTQADWKEELETSDYALFERLTDLSILTLVQDPPEKFPEFFSDIDLSTLREKFEDLPGEDKEVLKQKLMGQEIELDNKSQDVFRRLTAIRSTLQNQRTVWATLMQTLTLSLK